ncbi:unnamed protein product [Symbiodinium natans]|uniref:Membrane transporter protein n=1 Tax=Symbiodinium natans TaxID=878477 RepID=A0A812JMH8_9DINO|nr:unnamed protein product [Symbiodinium natans]
MAAASMGGLVGFVAQHMYVTAISLCFLIGLSLGLLGSGGSILTLPILVYLLNVEAKEAIAMSLVVVGITSSFALIAHAFAGNVDWRVGGVFGVAGMVGAYVGGILAGFVPEHVLLCLFAIMTLATAMAMLYKDTRPPSAYQPIAHDSNEEGPADKKEVENSDDSDNGIKLAELPLWHILAEGFVVGLVTGMVGAGGGFLVVPALTLMAGLPMSSAIGTSLMVIAMKCLAGYIGHASHVAIDIKLTLIVSASAVLGSFLGGYLTEFVPQHVLRKSFAIFVLTIGCLQLWKESSSFVQ